MTNYNVGLGYGAGFGCAMASSMPKGMRISLLMDLGITISLDRFLSSFRHCLLAGSACGATPLKPMPASACASMTGAMSCELSCDAGREAWGGVAEANPPGRPRVA